MPRAQNMIRYISIPHGESTVKLECQYVFTDPPTFDVIWGFDEAGNPMDIAQLDISTAKAEFEKEYESEIFCWNKIDLIRDDGC